jgi:hypothetical protein
MSPSAEPAHLAADAATVVPAEHLQDGEVVILAVKPSRWFALLVSWPWIVLAGIVAVATWLAGGALAASHTARLVVLACCAVACTRVTVACFQWLGRLYVLTDRRVLRFRGIFREEVYGCPLRHLLHVHLSATLPERALGVGSLLFQGDDRAPAGEGHWLHLARPQEVLRLVEEARHRAR